jgi:hypothetical protein
MKLGLSKPKRVSEASHWLSLTSVLRPGTCLTWRALTTSVFSPAASSAAYTLFQ